MDCQYEIAETLPDGRRRLRCRRPDCLREILSLYGPELTHTRCTAAGPPPPRPLAEILDAVRRSLPEHLSTDPAAWSQIAGRVAVCTTCPLDRFDPIAGTCTDQGSACRHFRRWLERLAVGSCRGWEEESGKPKAESRHFRGLSWTFVAPRIVRK
ncbi:MAG: hypothetical protein ACYS5V_02950 [Planctomycetota bacterium]|jgi:hypothetical protein